MTLNNGWIRKTWIAFSWLIGFALGFLFYHLKKFDNALLYSVFLFFVLCICLGMAWRKK